MRVAGLALTLLVLDGAAWSWAFANGHVPAARMRYFPERMQGEEVTLSLVRVLRLHDDGFVVAEGPVPFRVHGDPGDLRVGEEVYVRGRFHGERELDLLWVEKAPDRRGKRVLGLLGLGICGLTVLGGCTVGRQGVGLRG